MYRLAWNLTGTIKDNPQNLSEAISIYERIHEICTDPKLRAKTVRDLIYRYATAGDEEKALTIAEKLPDFAFCKEYNLGRNNLLYNRELAAYLQKNIRLYGTAMKECLEYFLNENIISETDMFPYSIDISRHKPDLLDQILE